MEDLTVTQKELKDILAVFQERGVQLLYSVQDGEVKIHSHFEEVADILWSRQVIQDKQKVVIGMSDKAWKNEERTVAHEGRKHSGRRYRAARLTLTAVSMRLYEQRFAGEVEMKVVFLLTILMSLTSLIIGCGEVDYDDTELEHRINELETNVNMFGMWNLETRSFRTVDHNGVTYIETGVADEQAFFTLYDSNGDICAFLVTTKDGNTSLNMYATPNNENAERTAITYAGMRIFGTGEEQVVLDSETLLLSGKDKSMAALMLFNDEPVLYMSNSEGAEVMVMVDVIDGEEALIFMNGDGEIIWSSAWADAP